MNTDVVVLAVASAQQLDLVGLWIAFGVEKNFRFFAGHEIAKVLGLDWYIALPMFHAFTGCDTVSFFGGKGKRTAWDTWRAYKEVTPAFCALAGRPTRQTVQEWFEPLERFVILLYDRSSSQEYVKRLGNSSSPKKEGQLRVCHLHKLHLLSISRGLLTRLVTTEHRW